MNICECWWLIVLLCRRMYDMEVDGPSTSRRYGSAKDYGREYPPSRDYGHSSRPYGGGDRYVCYLLRLSIDLLMT
jgi:hypothetical protein